MVQDQSRAGMGVVAPPGTVELEVSGLYCASCAALIRETLGAAEGVTDAKVDLDAGRASVVLGLGAPSVDELSAVVASAGSSASPLRPGRFGSLTC